MPLYREPVEELPRYRLIEDFFGPDCVLYHATEGGNPTEIDFDGPPNEQMEPLNEPARVKMRAYLEELRAGAIAKAEKDSEENASAASLMAKMLMMMQGLAPVNMAAAPKPIDIPMPSMPVRQDDIPIRPDIILPGERRPRVETNKATIRAVVRDGPPKPPAKFIDRGNINIPDPIGVMVPNT